MKSICGDNSGQALIEACLGMSLLILVGALITYIGFMVSCNIRVTMAARHAAWVRGNGGQPTTAQLWRDFFFEADSNLLKLEEAGSRDATESIPEITTIDPGLRKIIGDARIFGYRVSYGIDSGDDERRFPYSLLMTKPPFGPSAFFDSLLRVEASCYWDQVSDPWTTMSRMMSWLKSSFANQMRAELTKIGTWLEEFIHKIFG